MAATPPIVGAKQWDDAVQSQTPQTSQNRIPMIVGGPQGRVYAPVGYLAADDQGRLWSKTTDSTLATGWVLVGQGTISGSGGVALRDEASIPEPDPDDTSIVWFLSFRNGAPGKIWDPVNQLWI